MKRTTTFLSSAGIIESFTALTDSCECDSKRDTKSCFNAIADGSSSAREVSARIFIVSSSEVPPTCDNCRLHATLRVFESVLALEGFEGSSSFPPKSVLPGPPLLLLLDRLRIDKIAASMCVRALKTG